mgnify:CR=1 FL=1
MCLEHGVVIPSPRVCCRKIASTSPHARRHEMKRQPRDALKLPEPNANVLKMCKRRGVTYGCRKLRQGSNADWYATTVLPPMPAGSLTLSIGGCDRPCALDGSNASGWFLSHSLLASSTSAPACIRRASESVPRCSPWPSTMPRGERFSVGSRRRRSNAGSGARRCCGCGSVNATSNALASVGDVQPTCW